MESVPEKATSHSTFISKANAFISVIVSSHIVKGSTFLLILFYCLSFSDSTFVQLSVVPGYLIPPHFWIWTLLTHNFLQRHICMVLIDICVVILSSKLLEPLWSTLQIGLFFVIVCPISAILTIAVYITVYYISFDTDYIFETYIHGLGAYIGGFCVIVKQLMPEEILLRLPFGKIRNKHIPIICLVAAISLSLCGILNGPYAIHFGFGIIVSWVYLRFYQRHSNGSKGDMAEDFSFARYKLIFN